MYNQWYKNWSKTIVVLGGVRRDVRDFLGSILALFRPSGPLCFPDRQGAFSAEGGKSLQQQQEQQEGSMSHMFPRTTSGIKTVVENYCLSRVSGGDVGGTLRARFWKPFRPSGPLCFPVRQGAFSASEGRAAAATGAAGGWSCSPR